MGVVGRDAARVGEVIDFASEDALGVCAVRGVARGPGGAGGGPGDARVVWYRGRRLVAFDGSTLNVPDEATNRQAFGAPGASRGRAAFPQVRLTALVEVGTRAAFAWRAGAV